MILLEMRALPDDMNLTGQWPAKRSLATARLVDFGNHTQLIQVKVRGLEAGEASYSTLEALQMVVRFQKCGSRGKHFAKGALRLVVIAAAATAILTLATARESQASPSAETSAASELASVSTGRAVFGNLKCCDVGSQQRSGAPCSNGYCSACWTAVPIVSVAIVSPDDFAEHVLIRDVNFLPTSQTPKFRPPCILI